VAVAVGTKIRRKRKKGTRWNSLKIDRMVAANRSWNKSCSNA
jgi:hypothetical protein